MIVKKIEYLAENFDVLKKSKKVTELKGKHKGKYRFVVARKIRVIFQVKDNELIILILRVGKSKDMFMGKNELISVKFEGKIYNKYGKKQNSLNHLCKDIFLSYLKKYPDKSFLELREIFKKFHSLKKKIILNEEEYNDFLLRRNNSQKYKRYFKISYNGKNYYFTSQNWGKENARNNLIEFAIKENFEIKILKD